MQSCGPFGAHEYYPISGHPTTAIRNFSVGFPVASFSCCFSVWLFSWTVGTQSSFHSAEQLLCSSYVDAHAASCCANVSRSRRYEGHASSPPASAETPLRRMVCVGTMATSSLRTMDASSLQSPRLWTSLGPACAQPHLHHPHSESHLTTLTTNYHKTVRNGQRPAALLDNQMMHSLFDKFEGSGTEPSASSPTSNLKGEERTTYYLLTSICLSHGRVPRKSPGQRLAAQKTGIAGSHRHKTDTKRHSITVTVIPQELWKHPCRKSRANIRQLQLILRPRGGKGCAAAQRQ